MPSDIRPFKVSDLRHGATYLVQHSYRRGPTGRYSWCRPYETRVSLTRRAPRGGYLLEVIGAEFTEKHYCGDGIFDRCEDTGLAVQIIGLDGAKPDYSRLPPEPANNYVGLILAHVRSIDAELDPETCTIAAEKRIAVVTNLDHLETYIPAVASQDLSIAIGKLRTGVRELITASCGPQILEQCGKFMTFSIAYKRVDADGEFWLPAANDTIDDTKHPIDP